MNVELSDVEKVKIWNGDTMYKIMRLILLRSEEIDRNKEHFWIAGLPEDEIKNLKAEFESGEY